MNSMLALHEGWQRHPFAGAKDTAHSPTPSTRGHAHKRIHDKNGNLVTDATGGHQGYDIADDLSYVYDPKSNQLLDVVDNADYGLEPPPFPELPSPLTSRGGGYIDMSKGVDNYSYDANGNLVTDANKGITSVLYNHLNMPTEVKFDNSNTQKINYTYAADRTKLRKVTNDNGSVTTTDYIGNYVYENGSLKQITQPEGYIEPNGSGWQYVYRLTDIWGNTRITFADDNNDGVITASSEIRREQNYYPGGLEHRGYNNVLNGVKNNLKTYQKQEFTEDLGLNTHEWKYRISDPATLRFWQIDPLAEDFYYNSTYAFQENKLGMGIELEGAELLGFDIAQDLIMRGQNLINGTSNMVEGGAKMLNEATSGNTAVRLAQQSNSPGEVTVNKNFQQVLDGASQVDSALPNKQDVRNTADALEVGGDSMVVASPLAGPGAPAAATIGETASTVGTGINIAMDLAEGDVRSAAKRAVIEVVSGGLSSIAKQSPHVDAFAEQAIDTHILFYENIVVPKVENRTEEKKKE